MKKLILGTLILGLQLSIESAFSQDIIVANDTVQKQMELLQQMVPKAEVRQIPLDMTGKNLWILKGVQSVPKELNIKLLERPKIQSPGGKKSSGGWQPQRSELDVLQTYHERVNEAAWNLQNDCTAVAVSRLLAKFELSTDVVLRAEDLDVATVECLSK